MSSQDHTQLPVHDPELLSLARVVLESENYSVEEVLDNRLHMLFGENRYFIIAVVSSATISDLLLIEGVAEETIAQRLREADLGPKLWDAYLILLTQERLPEAGDATEQLFRINYDTQGLRRIAHSGVAPTLAEVRAALIPFVAPIELEDPSISEDAFEQFVDALVRRGIEHDIATRAVSAFRQGARLDDAF